MLDVPAENHGNCILCLGKNLSRLSAKLFKCNLCKLTLKTIELRLNPSQEKARYLLHQNRIDDKGYLDFLSPVISEVSKHKPPPSKGLDYGCGPNLVLSNVLQSMGYEMEAYDPFFYPTESEGKFDFITCTEAAEHFYEPAKEFKKLFSLLKKDGILVLMTTLYTEDTDFANWYYAKDPTHVTFYSEQTLKHIADKAGYNIKIVMDKVCIFFPKVNEC